MSVPIGLQFGPQAQGIRVQGSGTERIQLLEPLRGGRGKIQNRDAGLSVPGTETLALVGSTLALEGGILNTYGGRIELGSVAGPSLVSLTPVDKGWMLGYSGVPTFENIQLSAAAVLTVSSAGGGDVQVQGRRVTLQDGSTIEANTLTLEPGEMTGTSIEANTLASEPGGMLTVSASELVEVIGTSANNKFSSGLFADVGTGATGNGSDLTIETGQLSVQNGAQIAAATSSNTRAAGTLKVSASESVEVIGTSANSDFPSGLFTSVAPGAAGKGGDLIIETGRLIVRGGGVSSGTLGQGSGGLLSVIASESVEVSGTSIIDSDGRPTPSFLTAGTGVPQFFSLPGEFQGNTGQGGNLNIKTGRLSVKDGAIVSVATSDKSSGAAGTLTVDATESVEVVGKSPDEQHISQLAVDSQGSGSAGNLEVTARSIHLDNSGKLTAGTASGQGGDIKLQNLDLLLLQRSSQISTAAGGTGNGGNIDIDADLIVAFPSEDSDIIAGAIEGRGGNIDITTQGIFGIQPREQQTFQSDITASSELGIDGTVEINRLDVDPSQGLIILPAELVDVSNQIATGCPASVRAGESKFVITGRGGLPPNPNEPLTGDNVLTEWNTLDFDAENYSNAAPATSSIKESVPTRIVEANGWMIDDKGDVVLTASAPTDTLDIPWLPDSNCHASETES